MSLPLSQELESYVPVYDAIPESWDEAKPFLVEQLKKISQGVNAREIGFFIDEEVLTGKSFIPTAAMSGSDSSNSQQFRTILRRVYDFGALPNAAQKTIPLNITFDSNFTLIQLWASSTDPIALEAIPIPYVSQTENQEIEIRLEAGTISIRTAIDYTRFTSTFVVLEYIQEI